jgi:hypothetical protein
MLTLDREFGFVFVTSHKYKFIEILDPFKLKNKIQKRKGPSERKVLKPIMKKVQKPIRESCG